jgi:hypothetical protein
VGSRIINPQEEFEKLVPIAISKACFSVKLDNSDYLKKFQDMVDDMTTYGQQYTSDGGELNERVKNGIGAQLALENYLGITFTKWGGKKPDGIPDLLPAGFKIGVKSFKAPKNAPLISKTPSYPEIIMAIDENDKSIFHCLGIFGPTDLKNKEYTCDSLKQDPKIHEYKTGFYRIDKGIPFNSFDQLIKLTKGKWII